MPNAWPTALCWLIAAGRRLERRVVEAGVAAFGPIVVLLGQDSADGQGGECLNFCAPPNRVSDDDTFICSASRSSERRARSRLRHP
jgi:hypothetical protein